MRLVFFGTPKCAAQYLRPLAAAHELAAVVTQPDRPCGRGRRLAGPPVKTEALALGVAVLQPESPSEPAFVARMGELAPEAFVVVAYGRLLRRRLLAIPSVAALNVHYSLLPKLRGAAPVQHALLQGLTTTGVTVQHIAERLDAGDIVLQHAVPIGPEDDCCSLTARLTVTGIRALLEALDLLARGVAPRLPQDEAAATYAPPLSRADARIRWDMSATDIVNTVRALCVWPGACCEVQGRQLKILRASVAADHESGNREPGVIVDVSRDGSVNVRAGCGAVRVEVVQPEGGRAMPAADFIRGARLGPGARLQGLP